MELEASIGLGLYVSGIVLFVRTLEEYLPLNKRRAGRWASIITLILFGVMLMIYCGEA
jgi:hypothetical protein